MKHAGDRLTTAALTLAIVGLASILVYREFLRRPAQQPFPKPTYVAEWESALEVTMRSDAIEAPVRIVEFIDLECPACSSYAPVIEAIRGRFGDRVSIRYAHFPLAYHEHALSAAHAAECADRAGHGTPFVMLALTHQKAFATTPWPVLAARAGVTDTIAFRRCLEQQEHPDRVASGLEVGKRLGVSSTPTLFVEGWRFDHLPSTTQLATFISDLLDGDLVHPAVVSASGALHPMRYQDGDLQVLAFDSTSFARVPAWETEGRPLAEVGGIDATNDLTDAMQFLVLSDGRIVVGSPRGPELRIFTADGAESRVIGRSGEGPGEWKSLTTMARTAGDTIVFIDPGTGRLNRIAARDGSVASRSVVGRIPVTANRVVGTLDGGATLVSMLGRLPPRAGLGRARTDVPLYVLPRGDTARAVLTLPDVEYEVVETHYAGQRGTEPVPVGYGTRTRIVTWDGLIVVHTGLTWQIDLYYSKGAPVRAIRVAEPRRAVTGEMREAEIARRLDELASYREQPIDPAESRRLIQEMPFADSLPPLDDLFVSPDGTLWVTDEPRPGTADRTATAFRSDGAMIRRLAIRDRGTPVAFGDDRVLVRGVDQDGVVTLRMLRMAPLPQP